MENEFCDVRSAPLSTFGLDVDTASYGNVRALLRGGLLPPADAVRVEEFVNAFRYRDPEPSGGDAARVSALWPARLVGVAADDGSTRQRRCVRT